MKSKELEAFRTLVTLVSRKDACFAEGTEVSILQDVSSISRSVSQTAADKKRNRPEKTAVCPLELFRVFIR